MTTRRWGIHKEREKICEVCGDKFRTTHARSKYCGDNCLRVANGHVVRIIRCVICGTAAQRSSPRQVTCMGDECRRLHTNAYHASRRQKRPERPFSCKHCGRSTTRQGTNRRRYCEVCTDIKHRYDVGNSHRARARKNGGDVAPVNPWKVFVRDGWRCQICGCKTPRSAKGKGRPNSPEIDHIVPLRVGGDHTYDNVQCACRTCNRSKGAIAKGQMRLGFHASSDEHTAYRMKRRLRDLYKDPIIQKIAAIMRDPANATAVVLWPEGLPLPKDGESLRDQILRIVTQ
jgi:hypothetical protein